LFTTLLAWWPEMTKQRHPFLASVLPLAFREKVVLDIVIYRYLVSAAISGKDSRTVRNTEVNTTVTTSIGRDEERNSAGSVSNSTIRARMFSDLLRPKRKGRYTLDQQSRYVEVMQQIQRPNKTKVPRVLSKPCLIFNHFFLQLQQETTKKLKQEYVYQPSGRGTSLKRLCACVVRLFAVAACNFWARIWMPPPDEKATSLNTSSWSVRRHHRQHHRHHQHRQLPRQM
jgi:hypothetical protein